MKFEKWHGLGNDFILVKDMKERIKNKKNLAIQLCNRNFSIGADGLVFISSSKKANYKMRIFNPDGSEAEMCGNAIRCVTKLIGKPLVTIETLAGIMKCVLLDNRTVRVNMGKPVCIKRHNGMISLLMGVPHAIIYVDNFDFDWQKQGKAIENRTDLFPKKTNVEFVKIINKKNLEVKVWERGAGPTLACGTGACAAAVISIIDKKVEREVTVSLPGGKLLISWSKTDNNVYMTGEATKVFEGVID